MPDLFCFTRDEEYQELTSVIQNFIRYLQYHRVCVELTAALNATLRVCDLASRELPACAYLQKTLPGAFNTAASTLFDGFFKDTYAGNEEWAKGPASDGIDVTFGLSGKNARQLFVTGVVAYEHQRPGSGASRLQDPAKQRVSARETEVDVEIVEIHQPPKHVQELYHHMQVPFDPPGYIICKTWNAPTFMRWDLPPNVPVPKDDSVSDSKTYKFLLEESLLSRCQPGLKIVGASVIHLEPSGIQILDNVPFAVLCSFYTQIENELVDKWKEPRWITRQEQKDREEARENPSNAQQGDIQGPAATGANEEQFDDELD